MYERAVWHVEYKIWNFYQIGCKCVNKSIIGNAIYSWIWCIYIYIIIGSRSNRGWPLIVRLCVGHSSKYREKWHKRLTAFIISIVCVWFLVIYIMRLNTRNSIYSKLHRTIYRRAHRFFGWHQMLNESIWLQTFDMNCNKTSNKCANYAIIHINAYFSDLNFALKIKWFIRSRQRQQYACKCKIKKVNQLSNIEFFFTNCKSSL